MATDLRTVQFGFTTDGEFRAWGSSTSAQLAAVGLVKTSDTGQIDWTTAVKPSASGTNAGYEIWRFDDSLQATKPVFIRLDYGTGAFSAGRPRIMVGIGTATNGAGTLTGNTASTITVDSPQSYTNTAVGTRPSYCSGDSGRLSLCNVIGSAVEDALIVLVERTKTGAGVPTDDGIVMCTWSAMGQLRLRVVPRVGTVPSAQNLNPALDLNSGGSSAVGSDVAFAPTIVFCAKPLFASWCAYKRTDPGISDLTPITVDHLGATRTYMPLGANAASTYYTLPGVTTMGLAMLWE